MEEVFEEIRGKEKEWEIDVVRANFLKQQCLNSIYSKILIQFQYSVQIFTMFADVEFVLTGN